ncbi:MAG: NlpC/P60 family protein [Pseudomonadota bacterium]
MHFQDTVDRRAVALARQWIGTPYRHQASLQGVGCDCLGLLRGLWRELYGQEPQTVPAYSSDWAEVGTRETLLEAAQNWLLPVESREIEPGYIILFRMRRSAASKHVGLAVSNDRFIHAYEAAGVVETRFDRFWRARIAYCFQFPKQAPQV